MVNNNLLPRWGVMPESPICARCDIADETFDLLKEMQTANVPIIPTNDRIKSLVNIVCRPDANWNDDIAKEVIKIYDIIAPWKNRIYEIWRHCDLTCDSMEHKERGQNSCDHIFYNWVDLIGAYEQHAIAYRSQFEPPQAAEATAKVDAPTIDKERLKKHFNKQFNGIGENGYNYFEDMVKDIQNIKTNKERAMVALMIYNCNTFFIKRPSTFAAWLREFFDIIGRDCPADLHPNKYKPNKMIERLFYYLR